MKPIAFLAILLLFVGASYAQNKPALQPFGKIDTADLRLSNCAFEKDANALVLFDHADITATLDSIAMTRHKRIKIFNDRSMAVANIRLSYYSYEDFEKISGIEAQTIRLENNKIIITKLDPKLIYTETTDKYRKALVFTFPEVKPGCIIEYRYKWKTSSPANFPTWFFQSSTPTRYSELDANIAEGLNYTIVKKGYQQLARDTSETFKNKKGVTISHGEYLALSNIHSFVSEPFITPGAVNLQCVMFQLRNYSYRGYMHQMRNDTWLKIVSTMVQDEDFGQQLDVNLNKEEDVVAGAAKAQTTDQLIAYVFNIVKNHMTWNNVDAWYTEKGVRSAWAKKTGNSTEINLALYNLLTKVGVYAQPMAVSTRENDAINPYYAGFSQINKTVVYVKPDSAHVYILDASGKYNVYNDVPADLLNTYGVLMNEKNPMDTRLIFLKNETPARQLVLIDAEIKPDNKIAGKTIINCLSYNKATWHMLYDNLGADKYKDYIRGDNNNLKVTDVNMENMEVDSLPLVNKFNFNLNLNESVENYIYFSPNLFTPLTTNPFVNEERFSDIDFGSCNSFTIYGKYKMPAGYKIEGLPKNIQVNLFGNDIVFKRAIGEEDGILEVRYIIDYKKSMFGVDQYKDLRAFYKKMYELLNEPIVLKKV